MNTTFRRQGDPAQCGWSIGRAPLALRGIRLIEGEGGSAPGAGENGGQQPAAPAASPADVASMLQALGKVAAPSQPQAPAQPAAQQQIQGFTPEQVQKLMADNAAAQKALEDAQTALTKANEERDGYKGQVDQFAREKAVTTAAGAAEKKGNAALLLDSASFQAAIKDVDLGNADKLAAAVSEFVEKNPAYAATPAAPPLPGSSGPAPSGGAVTTLEQQLAAAQEKGDQTEVIRLTRAIAFAKRA